MPSYDQTLLLTARQVPHLDCFALLESLIQIGIINSNRHHQLLAQAWQAANDKARTLG
jgi:hypothetical protein